MKPRQGRPTHIHNLILTPRPPRGIAPMTWSAVQVSPGAKIHWPGPSGAVRRLFNPRGAAGGDVIGGGRRDVVEITLVGTLGPRLEPTARTGKLGCWRALELAGVVHGIAQRGRPGSIWLPSSLGKPCQQSMENPRRRSRPVPDSVRGQCMTCAKSTPPKPPLGCWP